MTATKTKKNSTKGHDQGTLMEPEGEYKQGAVDGSGTIKQTAPKHIQNAANDWFACKAKENLAKNNYPIDQTVAVADEALWNSPSHRANILNANYTDAGIALAVDATGMNYFTILFTGP